MSQSSHPPKVLQVRTHPNAISHRSHPPLTNSLTRVQGSMDRAHCPLISQFLHPFASRLLRRRSHHRSSHRHHSHQPTCPQTGWRATICVALVSSHKFDTVGEVSKDGERSDAGCVGARFIAPWVGWATLRQQDQNLTRTHSHLPILIDQFPITRYNQIRKVPVVLLVGERVGRYYRKLPDTIGLLEAYQAASTEARTIPEGFDRALRNCQSCHWPGPQVEYSYRTWFYHSSIRSSGCKDQPVTTRGF